MDPEKFSNTEAGFPIRTPLKYWAFHPSPLPPNLTWSLPLVSALAEAERELGRLAALASVIPFPRLLVQPFIHNEAVMSSRIEGTRASLEDIFRFEVAQLSFFERVDDVREVSNYVRATDHGLERLKTLPVSMRLIRELHAILTENVRGGALTPGEFRRSQNWIGPPGSTPETAPYVPPPVDEMHIALDDLEKFIHTPSELPALIRIGLIHYQFEAIHPFLDGNGRVGRLLISLLLSEWGLLVQPILNLSVFIERYRQQYYDLLLDVSQNGTWENWLCFFLKGVSDQARQGASLIQRSQEIRKSYQAIIERDRNPVRMAAVVDFLFSRPILSIKQAAESLNIPFKTAQDYFTKLEAAGILREVTGQARNRIFRADEIMKLF